MYYLDPINIYNLEPPLSLNIYNLKSYVAKK